MSVYAAYTRSPTSSSYDYTAFNNATAVADTCGFAPGKIILIFQEN